MAKSHIARAVAILGGKAAFIAAVGISPRTLSTWLRDGVPDTRWRDVANACGGAVTVEQLAAERARLVPQRGEAA